MTEQLHTASDIMRMFDVSRVWVGRQAKRHSSLRPQFVCTNKGGKLLQLWTDAGLARWRIYLSSISSDPEHTPACYSCLRAVNYLGVNRITWKLWWRNTNDGGTVWYFSTPAGWYTSADFGNCWEPKNTMMLDGSYHYFAVNVLSVQNNHSWVVNVLHTTDRLRRRIERQMESETA